MEKSKNPDHVSPSKVIASIIITIVFVGWIAACASSSGSGGSGGSSSEPSKPSRPDFTVIKAQSSVLARYLGEG